jgi:hypothetical protein
MEDGNVMATMNGVILPRDSTVKHVEVDYPRTGTWSGVAADEGIVDLRQ